MPFPAVFYSLKTGKNVFFIYICNDKKTILAMKMVNIRFKLERKFISLFIKRQIPEEKAFLDRRRQGLATWYVSLITVGILADLLELSGSFSAFYKYSNSIMLLLIFTSTACYLLRKTNILQTVSLLSLTTLLFISTDTIYCALMPSVPHTNMVILVNMLILTANIMFSIATYQTVTTMVNVVVSITTFFACMILTNNKDSLQYVAMMTLIFIYIGILGLHITRNSKHLQDENTTIKNEEEELMHLLRLNKEQLKLFMKLAKQEYDENETRLILAQFNEKTQKYIIDNVKKYLDAESSTEKRIEKAFPQLTASERDIARMILRGHKLGAICTMLNKTESNVNTHRANIRRKLKLQPNDNLYDFLKARVRE